MGCVYLAINKINKKLYVGKTIGTLEERHASHIRETRKEKQRNRVFIRALNKYGDAGFDWKVLFESDVNEELLEREMFCIRFLETKVPKGYNMTDGGEGIVGIERTPQWLKNMSLSHLGIHPSEEARKKMSNSHILRYINHPEQRENVSRTSKKLWEQRTTEERIRISFLGKKHSEETKEKLRKINLERELPEGIGEKISKAKKGKKASPERAAQLREQLNKIRHGGSPEHMEMLRQLNLGKKLSSEHIEALRKANTGRPQSESERAKKSEALKKSWIRRKQKSQESQDENQ